MLDPLLNIILEGSTFGVIAVAMVVAYRWTKRAHLDALQVYKDMTNDASDRLSKEREAWSVDRGALISRIQELEGHHDKEHWPALKEQDTTTKEGET